MYVYGFPPRRPGSRSVGPALPAMHEPMLANETLDEDMLSDPEVVSILAGEFAWQEVPYESQQPLWMEDADYGDGQLKQPL